MNTEQMPVTPKQDFTQLKTGLNNLITYINNKNNVMAAPIQNQEMNLASQPEVKSDHLEEEVALTPDGVNNTTELVEGAPSIAEQPIEAVPEIAPVENPQAVAPSLVDESAPRDELVQEQSAMPEPTPAPEPAVPEVPSVLDTSANGLTQEPVPQPSGLENQVPAGFEQGPGSNGLETPVPTPQPNAVEDNQNVNTESGLIDPIPDIVIPEETMSGSEPVPETYVATGTGAATEIQDVTPKVPAVPVVMPNGTTPEIANDQNIVVGPEAFGQSR